MGDTICIHSSYLPSDPVCAPLPDRNLMTPAMQDELDSIDRTPDRVIHVSLDRGIPKNRAIEASLADAHFARLSRSLWRFSGAPFETREGNAHSLVERTSAMLGLQKGLHERAVLPVLGGYADHEITPEQAEAGLRGLELTGDFVHLYEWGSLFLEKAKGMMGSRLVEDWEPYLKMAYDYYMAAQMYASGVRLGRERYQGAIELKLNDTRLFLQTIHDLRQKENKRYPYLLAARGSPMGGDVTQRQGETFFAVSVPESFLKEHGGDVEAALKDYYKNTETISARPSVLQDALSQKSYRLVPTSVQIDRPGPEDDVYGATTSYHLYQDRLNRQMFDGEKRAYFRVGFQFERPEEAAAALEGRDIRKFDLLFGRGGRTVREVEGAFTLQRPTRKGADGFFGDSHVTDDDWRMIRWIVMGAQKYGRALTERELEEIERFYESVNNQLDLYVQQGQEEVRAGRRGRDFGLGDIYDKVNLALTLARMGYYQSEAQYFLWLFRRYEGIVYADPGNHGHRGIGYRREVSPGYFYAATPLRSFLKHADRLLFGRDGGGRLDDIKALLTRSVAGWDEPSPLNDEQPRPQDDDAAVLVAAAFAEINAQGVWEISNDDFLGPFLEEINPYEMVSVRLGTGIRVVVLPSESDHFTFMKDLVENVEEPVADSVWQGFKTAALQQSVNLKGPTPEWMLSFIGEVEDAHRKGESVIVGSHASMFGEGKDPLGLESACAVMRYIPNLLLRLIQFKYRNQGRPTVRLAIGAHRHKWAEVAHSFYLRPDEAGPFDKELTLLLARKDLDTGEPRPDPAGTLFEDVNRFAERWALKDRMELAMSFQAGTDGWPGPLGRAFNSGELEQPFSVTVDSIGEPGGSQVHGYLKVHTDRDGRMEIDPRLIREEPDGTVIETSAERLTEYRAAKAESEKRWDPSNPRRTSYDPPTRPTGITHRNAQGTKRRLVDAPLVYQYARGKYAVNGYVSTGYDFYHGTEFGLGADWLFPLTNKAQLTVGRPTYLATGIRWFFYANRQDGIQTHNVEGRVGLSLGRLKAFFTAGGRFNQPGLSARDATELGGEVCAEWILPFLPRPCLFARSDLLGNPSVGLGVESPATFVAAGG